MARRKTVKIDTTPSVVRSWAKDNGVEVGTRGRLSADVVTKYTEAQTAKSAA